MEKPIIKLVDIHKSFGNAKILDGINLEVFEGEVLCIIGPSGGGKTTLLRCMNLLENIDSGEIYFDNVLLNDKTNPINLNKTLNASNIQRQIGLVFQHLHLWPHKTALQNVVEALLLVNKLPLNKALEHGRRYLAQVDMLEKADFYPDSLSGGQQQRTAIARALAIEPKLLLLDEITSALDPELVGEILDIIKGLAMNNTTMVIVTHEMMFARDVASRVVFLNDGKIEEEDEPEVIFSNPKKKRTKDFLSRVLHGHWKNTLE